MLWCRNPALRVSLKYFGRLLNSGLSVNPVEVARELCLISCRVLTERSACIKQGNRSGHLKCFKVN